MIYHLLLLILIMVITLIYEFGNQTQQNKKNCVIVVTVALTLFSGLRTWWYGDLIRYYTLGYRASMFSSWRDVLFGAGKNHGLNTFFKISTSLGLSYEICLFLIAAFIAITIGVAVYKYSPSPYWSYVMYITMGFFEFTLSGLKQTVAMGFCFIAIHYVFSKKKWKFVLFALLAAVFHAPAAIFLLAYPIAKLKINRKYFVLLAATVVAVFLFRNQIVGFFAEAYYDNSDSFASGSKLVGGRTIMMVFIIIFASFMRTPMYGDKVYSNLFNIMVFAAIIQTFSIYDNNFTRLADYYYVFVLLFFPFVMESGEHQAVAQPERAALIKYNALHFYVLAAVFVSLYSLYYYYRYISDSGIANNFKFCWQINAYELYGK